MKRDDFEDDDLNDALRKRQVVVPKPEDGIVDLPFEDEDEDKKQGPEEKSEELDNVIRRRRIVVPKPEDGIVDVKPEDDPVDKHRRAGRI